MLFQAFDYGEFFCAVDFVKFDNFEIFKFPATRTNRDTVRVAPRKQENATNLADKRTVGGNSILKLNFPSRKKLCA